MGIWEQACYLQFQFFLSSVLFRSEEIKKKAIHDGRDGGKSIFPFTGESLDGPWVMWYNKQRHMTPVI